MAEVATDGAAVVIPEVVVDAADPQDIVFGLPANASRWTSSRWASLENLEAGQTLSIAADAAAVAEAAASAHAATMVSATASQSKEEQEVIPEVVVDAADPQEVLDEFDPETSLPARSRTQSRPGTTDCPSTRSCSTDELIDAAVTNLIDNVAQRLGHEVLDEFDPETSLPAVVKSCTPRNGSNVSEDILDRSVSQPLAQMLEARVPDVTADAHGLTAVESDLHGVDRCDSNRLLPWKTREQQHSWVARVFTTLTKDELNDPSMSGRVPFKRRQNTVALRGHLKAANSAAVADRFGLRAHRSASTAALSAPSASPPLSSCARSLPSLASPPSAPAPSCCDLESNSTEMRNPSMRLLSERRSYRSASLNSVSDEDTRSVGSIPTAPACGLKRVEPVNSRVGSAARKQRDAVPGLDMTRVHMNYDDEEDEFYDDGSQGIGIHSVEGGSDRWAPPPDNVPRLDLAAALTQPSNPQEAFFSSPSGGGSPLDNTKPAMELDVYREAKAAFLRSGSESYATLDLGQSFGSSLGHSFGSSLGATVIRPVSRAGQQEQLGGSLGSSIGSRKQLPDFWVGQPERRRTLPEDPDPDISWTPGFQKRASSAAELHRPPAPPSQPPAPTDLWPTPGRSAFRQQQQAGQTQQHPARFSGEAAFTNKVAFVAATDPVGTIVVANGAGKQGLVEEASVRLPPVDQKSKKGGLKSGTQGLHMAKKVAFEVHMHSHFHHHYHVRGSPAVTTSTAPRGSVSYAAAEMDAFGAFAAGPTVAAA